MSDSYSQESNPGLWLGLSIASTLLCCLPFGVVGIVFAAKAMGDQARGDHSQAFENTRKARQWTIVSVVGFFVTVGVIYCLAPGILPS